jgi:uncharacterized protein (TIGR04255 family)
MVQMNMNAPDMPRVWFVSADDTCLIQLQPDRFLFNWREGPNRTPYPRYKTVIKKFRTLYNAFEKFVSQHKLGSIVPQQCELSYVNYIRQGQGWSTFADIGEIFPDLSWRKGDRFIPDPVNFNFQFPKCPRNVARAVTIVDAKREIGTRKNAGYSI